MLKLIFFLFLSLVDSFSNYNIPNKYFSNKIPSKDLIRITPSQASSYSKKWLEEMIFDITKNNKYDFKLEKLPQKLFELNNAHIVMNINQLEDYINNHRSINDIYLAWMPLSRKKTKSVLFIVVGEIDTLNKIFLVKQLVQSPNWDPLEICSNELRNALVNYTGNLDSCHIDLSYLYEHDLRYKLSWATWNLELDDD